MRAIASSAVLIGWVDRPHEQHADVFVMLTQYGDTAIGTGAKRTPLGHRTTTWMSSRSLDSASSAATRPTQPPQLRGWRQLTATASAPEKSSAITADPRAYCTSDRYLIKPLL
jgi:hypothetical protein